MQEICRGSERLSKMTSQIKWKTGITSGLDLTLTCGFLKKSFSEGVSLNKIKFHKIRCRSWSAVLS